MSLHVHHVDVSKKKQIREFLVYFAFISPKRFYSNYTDDNSTYPIKHAHDYGSILVQSRKYHSL